MNRLTLPTLFMGVVAACLHGQSVDYRNVINGPVQSVAKYRFTLNTGNVTSGSIATAGAKTLTIRPCPLGIAGANTSHYIRISGGTGTAEAVLITGGTCTSGAASGTLAFTTANTHTGAWKITSATDGIQEWFYGAAAPLNGFIPAGRSILYAKLTLYGRGGSTVRLTGSGHIATRIVRDSSYPSGDLIHYDATVAQGHLLLEDFGVLNSEAFDNPSGAGIHLTIGQPREAVLSRLVVSDGENPLVIDPLGGTGAASALIYDSYFIIYSAYHTVYNCGDAITLNVAAADLINVTGVVQTPGATTAGSGLKIVRSDGINVSGGGYSGKYGVKIENDSTYILNFISFSKVIFDSSYSHSFYIAPGTHNAVYNQVRIENSHFATQSGDTSASGIYVGNDIQALSIVGNTISGYYGSGITLGVSDKAPKGAVVSGNNINNNGQGPAGYGIVIPTTGTGGSGSYDTHTVITGNVIGNNISNYGAATQDVGIYFAGPAGKWRGYTVGDNDLTGNTVAAMFKDTTPTFEETAVGLNRGVSDTIAVVASGSLSAANAAAMYRNIEVTGTTNVTSLTPVWDGRIITFLKTDAGTVNFVTGGNIAANVALAQNASAYCQYYAAYTYWICR